ncbi:PREDICTED: uncharacterized protein LOC104805160 [Tarenaya hassleriana]|uniref:uncharacterized protein LOC104805160 n=1 Tax=Tarenaya hassleriana TaxID=28532 RepID=UPI00053C09D5|nr:PREDICTED: uncharacterized protein LOC104805160 [Tarenaya hassleriana]
MKEESVSGLISGGNLSGVGFGLVWESPSKRQASTSSCGDVGDCSRISCKRIKTTQVNGFIVYTRTKKTKLAQDGELAGTSDNKVLNRLKEPNLASGITNSSCDMSHNSLRIETDVNMSSHIENPLVESLSVDPAVEEQLDVGSCTKGLAVETSNELEIKAKESSIVDVIIESQFLEMLDEEIPVEVLPDGITDFDVESHENKSRIMDEPCYSSSVTMCREEEEHEGSTGRNHVALRHARQFRRSASRVKQAKNLESVDVEDAAELNCVSENLDEQTPPGSSSKKSNLILKRPMTVKELFDTGLLDGVSVVYIGSVKSQAFGLRGVIKDGGILCSCSLCNWAKVIPTSKFEIHACKQYRRASQYICFENGKSLLDVLKICRSTPLHELEAAICEAVSGASKEISFTCKQCKGVFPLSCFGHRGLLCSSCSEMAKTQVNQTTTRTPRSAPVCISSPTPSESQLKITRKSSEPMSGSPLGDNPRKITRKAIYQALVGKAYMSASASISSQNKCTSKFKKMLAQRSVIPKALKSVSPSISSEKNSHCKITKKDHRLHKFVFQSGGLPDGTELAYYARGQKLLEGYKKGAGIYCYCCKCEVSPSQFEVHAGWASRRKPYAYIYTSNGVSLHEWAITFSQGRKYSAKDNDDLCVICADGGDLLLCDSCPRAFHLDCISLPSIPRGKWCCKYCQKIPESETYGEHSINSVAAGRLIGGVDPVDQVANRCIRVVKNIEAETSGCVLCSGSDFSRSGFGPRTIIICDQCEKEYHIGCLRSQKIADLKELPKGNWFCSTDCTKIHSTLQKLLLNGAEKLSCSSFGIIKMKQERTDVEAMEEADIRWRLISGKVASPESSILLSQALAIFHDCFDPIVDPVSGRNLIPRMVYGKNMQGQDYGGMCCAILTVNSSVVSAGLLRVFGRDIAELPLVATSMNSRGKGYFQLLFSCIEKLLSFLNIEKIVLPAAEEAEPLWMNKYGFRKMAPDQLSKYMKMCYQMVRFKGASMLQKQVPSHQIIDMKIETDQENV